MTVYALTHNNDEKDVVCVVTGFTTTLEDRLRTYERAAEITHVNNVSMDYQRILRRHEFADILGEVP